MVDLVEIFEFSLDGKGGQSLAVDTKTNELYWNQQKIVTEKRFSNVERALAVAGLSIGAIGVIAACVQAYAAVVALGG